MHPDSEQTAVRCGDATAAIDEGDVNKVVFNRVGWHSSDHQLDVGKVAYADSEDPSLLVPNPRPRDVGELMFVMRVRDNGPGARVIATLKRVTLNYFGDGPQRSDVAATIDGDLFPPSDGWMTASSGAPQQSSSSCCWIRDPRTGIGKK